MITYICFIKQPQLHKDKGSLANLIAILTWTNTIQNLDKYNFEF